ncbi:hypothetical protein EKH55_4756 [Sinorhizobium alkalisoli]|nr:hypothetical protein EKH55_4756 [Sinorhizobium alkalisoli]
MPTGAGSSLLPRHRSGGKSGRRSPGRHHKSAWSHHFVSWAQ